MFDAHGTPLFRIIHQDIVRFFGQIYYVHDKIFIGKHRTGKGGKESKGGKGKGKKTDVCSLLDLREGRPLGQRLLESETD